MEHLEPRQLLTIISGGGMTASGIPIERSFDYMDQFQRIFRVAVKGNITATFDNVLTAGDVSNPTTHLNNGPPPGTNTASRRGRARRGWSATHWKR
jgi:hypothetical protein